MFKNLLKYDLHYIYKVLIFFYAITTICAILTRLCFNFADSTFLNFLGLILQGTTISLMISMLVNNLMRCWARFTKNFYGDESYLTHTLPIKISKLFTAKYVATLLTLLSTALVAILALIIMYYSTENLELIKSALTSLFDTDSLNLWGMILAVIVIFYLEVLCMVSVGYTGLILGHRFNSHKMVWSIFLGLVCYGLTQGLILAALYILALINPNVMTLFTDNLLPTTGIICLLIAVAIGLYTAWAVIYYVADMALLKRGVNID